MNKEPAFAQQLDAWERATATRYRAAEPASRGTDARATQVGSRGTRETPAQHLATADRGTGQVLSQEAPYATRAGPLMRMKASVEREARLKAARQRESELDALETRMRIREASVMGGVEAREIYRLPRGYGNEWLDKRVKEEEKTKGLKAAERFREKEQRRLKDSGLEELSCLTMLWGPLKGYCLNSLADQPDVMKKLDEAVKTAKDARGKKGSTQEVYGGRGTVLLEELRKKFGFETVHIDAVPNKDKYPETLADYTSDADVRRTHAVPTNPKTQLVNGADSGKPIDVHVQVERFIKLGKKPSTESRDLFESLKRVEFAVGVADSGMHTFALSGGMVYEVHWAEGPNSRELTSAKPLESFFKHWGSGVIAVPPGELNKSPLDPRAGQ